MPSRQFQEHFTRLPAGPPAFEPNEWGVPCEPEGQIHPVGRAPEGYTAEEVALNGVRGLHVTAAGARSDAAVLFIHGGGFTIGSGVDDRSAAVLVQFIAATGADGFSVDYALAPWQKFPTQVNQCVDFYTGILARGYRTVFVGGESAGAALTLSLTLALKQRNLPLPAGLWCSSPFDDICYAEREVFHPDAFMDSQDAILRAYAPDADPKDPLLSPIYGDFTGFPPMILQAGACESLAAGCVRLAEKAARAGVDVRFHLGAGMPHTFAMDYEFYPEAAAAFAEILAFVRDNLALADGE